MNDARQAPGPETKPEWAALAFASAADAIFVLDEDGAVLDLNAAAAAMLGAEAGEARGRPVAELAAGSRVERCLRTIARRGAAAASGRMDVGGANRLVECSFRRLQYDGRAAIVAVVRDVGARRRWEREMGAGRARLALAERMAGMGSWEWDRRSGQIWVSSSLRALFGWGRRERITPRLIVSSTYREDRSKVRKALSSAMQAPEPFLVEHRILRPDGALRYLRVRGEVRLGTDGSPIGMFGTIQDVTEQVLAEKGRQRLVRALATLSAANEALVRSATEADLLKAMCRAVVDVGGYKLAWVGLWSGPDELALGACAWADGYCPADARRLWGAAAQAFAAEPDFRPRVLRGRGVAANVPWEKSAWFGRLRSVAICPLGKSGKSLGVLAIYAEDEEAFEEGEIDLLARMAEDIVYGIESVRNREERAEARKKKDRTLGATIEALAGLAELRDPYTAGHQRRVGRLATAIAEEMGLDEDYRQAIAIAGLVHDIGKTRVPAEILNRPGRLRQTEREFIKIHPRAGYEVLSGVDFPWPVADIILQHHERMDGSGYPQGLKGDQILVGARVLAVADVVEAMARDRPYRPALGPGPALEEIARGRGTLYDPQVVDACLRLIEDKGYGLGE